MAISDPRRVLRTALLLLPPATALCFAVGIEPLPLMDGWAHLRWYVRIVEGQATLGELFAPDRMHWVVLPRAFRTALAFATDWTLAAETWTCVALAGATFWGLCRIALERAPEPRSGHVFAGNWISGFLLFTPACLVAWTWPPALVHFAMNAAVVLAARELQGLGGEHDRGRLIRAFALCSAASLIRAEGFLAWFLLAPVLIDRLGWGTRGRRVLGPWLALGLAALTAVLWAALRIEPARELPATPAPSETLAVLLNVIGLPLGRFVQAFAEGSDESRLYVPFGLLVFALLALLAGYFLFRADASLRSRALPWIALGLFGGGVALGIGLTRQVMMQAAYGHLFFLSMYGMAALPASIAAVQLSALFLAQQQRSPGWQMLRAAAVALAALCIVGNYAVWGPEAVEVHHNMQGAGVCLVLAEHWASPNTCFGPGPRPEQIELLKRSGFRELPEDLTLDPTPRPQRGAIRGHAWLRDGRLELWGEAHLPGGGEPARHVLFTLGGGEGFFAYTAVGGWPGPADAWRVRLPETLALTPGKFLRAWVYDAKRERATALAGGFTLDRPPPRAGAGALN